MVRPSWKRPAAVVTSIYPRYIGSFSARYYENTIDIEALQGGQVSLASLGSISPANSIVSLIADGTASQIAAGVLTQFNAFGGDFQVTNGGTIQDSNLTELSNVNVTLDGTGTLAFSQWISLTGSNLVITGGSYTFGDLTDFDSSSLNAESGATVSLPALTSYNRTISFGTSTLEATGNSSKLSLSGLLSVASVAPYYANTIDIQALQGGQVSIPTLSTVSAANSSVSLIANGSGSQIDVSALTRFNALGGNLKVTNTGKILDGNLTALSNVNVTLDGVVLWPPASGPRSPAVP